MTARARETRGETAEQTRGVETEHWSGACAAAATADCDTYCGWSLPMIATSRCFSQGITDGSSLVQHFTAFRNYGDVLIWTSHGDTETQRRSTRAACTAGRAVRRADRKRTTEPRSSGRSFAVGTPRPPLRGAASSALLAACSSLCLCVSVAKYVVVFLKWDIDRRHEIRHRNCEIEYLASYALRGTNARNRRGLSTRIVCSVASPTPAAWSCLANRATLL